MKKALLLFVVLSAVLAPLLVSCSNAGSSDGGKSNGGNTVTYTVTFNSGGGNTIPPQSVQSGGTADRPAAPRRSEYSFDNWYSDAGFQTVYNFDQPVTRDMTLYAAWSHELKSVIESGTIPADLDTYGSLVRAVLEPYAAGAAIVAKYVDVTPQGAGDASSWENAAGNIKTTVDGIADAEANKIYLVLLASGTHVPAATLAMKNHVAIVGGWNAWEQTGASTISGGNARQVFSNNGIDRTALLYGITIANGDSGTSDGGGMYNDNSSPTLSNVTFVNNEAAGGGGMSNSSGSDPILNNVTFSGNTATNGKGGGIANESLSVPSLINVTFFGNTATDGGGGISYESNSLASLVNVTFVNNKVTNGNGGGMYYNPSGGVRYNSANMLFWNNTGGVSSETTGQQIYIKSSGQDFGIFSSLVQHGIAETTDVTADTDQSDGLGLDITITGALASVTVFQLHNISGDPKLAADLADNGGFVQTIALLDNSAAINAGMYIKWDRDGTNDYYNSTDNTNWFEDFSSFGSAPPADALDLTATDARGYARNGRPDIGAYEYGGTAP